MKIWLNTSFKAQRLIRTTIKIYVSINSVKFIICQFYYFELKIESILKEIESIFFRHCSFIFSYLVFDFFNNTS